MVDRVYYLQSLGPTHQSFSKSTNIYMNSMLLHSSVMMAETGEELGRPCPADTHTHTHSLPSRSWRVGASTTSWSSFFPSPPHQNHPQPQPLPKHTKHTQHVVNTVLPTAKSHSQPSPTTHLPQRPHPLRLALLHPLHRPFQSFQQHTTRPLSRSPFTRHASRAARGLHGCCLAPHRQTTPPHTAAASGAAPWRRERWRRCRGRGHGRPTGRCGPSGRV